MLEHLSPKFKMPPMEREPRAALILNRFTRTLTIMFATNAVTTILGVRPDQVKDKSFYECIQENCRQEAIRVLESAKANDSIAYLRFWYRDPRRDEDFDNDEEGAETDGDDTGAGNSRQEGSAAQPMDVDDDEQMPRIKQEESDSEPDVFGAGSSGDATSSTNAPSAAPRGGSTQSQTATEAPRRKRRERLPTFELEAVVSCTSDGLVVVLRKARPQIPAPHPPLVPFGYENGLFAAPWGQQPIRPYYPPELLYRFQAPLMPQFMPLRENVKAAGGPPIDVLMRAIRDVAVFAWALVGINGNLASYGRGNPLGEAQPPDGLPIWDPTANTANTLTLGAHQYGEDRAATAGWTAQDSAVSKGKAPMTAEDFQQQQQAYLAPHLLSQQAQQIYGQHPSLPPPPPPPVSYPYGPSSMWPAGPPPPPPPSLSARYPSMFDAQQQQPHQYQQYPLPQQQTGRLSPPTVGPQQSLLHHHDYYQQHRQQQPAQNMPPEPWREASPGARPPTNHIVPTTPPPPGRSGGSPSNDYFWR